MLNKINQFVQEYSHKEYSFITGNGTSAIYLTLKASSLPKGSLIAVPNIACPDPIYSLIWAGYRLVFVDVNMDDYNMDVTKLEKLILNNKNIKAVIAIHLFGNPCDIESIQKICKKNNVFLLEDCAQSLGNEINGKKLGSFGDVSIFSFGNGKIIENGHGGSIQTNSKELFYNIQKEYEKLPKYNEVKINKLSKIHRSIYYKLYYLGIKYSKLNILNLVYVYFFKSYYLYKLDKEKLYEMENHINNFKKNRTGRIEIVTTLSKELKDINKITLPKILQKSLTRYTVLVDNAEKTSKLIRESGVPSNTMYPMLVDRFKVFYNNNNFKNSLKLKGRMLNLWTNAIDDKQLKQIIEILKDVK